MIPCTPLCGCVGQFCSKWTGFSSLTPATQSHSPAWRICGSARQGIHPELLQFVHDARDLLEARGVAGKGAGGCGDGHALKIFAIGKVVEQSLDDVRDACVVLGAPDADLAVGFVLDGDCDVAHDSSRRAGK